MLGSPSSSWLVVSTSYPLVPVRWLLLMIALGWFFAAGAAPAKADGIINQTEAEYILNGGAGMVCDALDTSPSTDMVFKLIAAIYEDGFSGDNAADIINASVGEFCPEYWDLLVQAREEATAPKLDRAI